MIKPKIQQIFFATNFRLGLLLIRGRYHYQFDVNYKVGSRLCVHIQPLTFHITSNLGRFFFRHSLFTKNARMGIASIHAAAVRGRRRLALHQRPMTLDFADPQQHKADDEKNPIHVVRNDGAISGRILPSENRSKDAPAAIAAALRDESVICLSTDPRGETLR